MRCNFKVAYLYIICILSIIPIVCNFHVPSCIVFLMGMITIHFFNPTYKMIKPVDSPAKKTKLGQTCPRTDPLSDPELKWVSHKHSIKAWAILFSHDTRGYCLPDHTFHQQQYRTLTPLEEGRYHRFSLSLPPSLGRYWASRPDEKKNNCRFGFMHERPSTNKIKTTSSSLPEHTIITLG